MMKEDEMIWGAMVQLGHNMWGEEPLVGEATPEDRDRYAQPFNRTDVKVWNKITEDSTSPPATTRGSRTTAA